MVALKRPASDPENSEAKPISSAFKLQCDEFAKELQHPKQLVAKWDELSQKICHILESAQLKHSCDYKSTAYWNKLKLVFPLEHVSSVIEASSSEKPTYKWIAPTQIKIAGPSLMKLQLRGKYEVKLFVPIPDELFAQRDYVNLVYPAKRAHYMSSCVLALQKALPALLIQFVPGYNNDLVFPDILVTDASSPLAQVRLHFYASEAAVGKPSRFSPLRGFVRPATVSKSYTGPDYVPTPVYNQRLIRTMQQLQLEQRIATELQSKPTVLQALSLLRAWLSSRSLNQFDHLLTSCLMIRMLKEGTVLSTHEPLIVFRDFCTALSSWDPATVIGLHSEGSVPDDVMAAFQKQWSVVFLDYSGYWNLAADVTVDQLNRVKSEMALCVPLLGDVNAFHSLFVDDLHFNTAFDHYFRLSLTSSQLKSLSAKFVADSVDEHDRLYSFLTHLHKQFHTAMSERFSYLDWKIVSGDVSSWSPEVAPSRLAPEVCILFGFKANKQWGNPITVGPSANEAAAKEFRSFWCGATQLRKFADTRICESMVWAESNSNAVPLVIIKFILERQLQLPGDCVSWRSAFPAALCSDPKTSDKIQTAYASLSSVLRSLKGIPLIVTNIMGVSPYLRGAEPNSHDVFPPHRGGPLEKDADHRHVVTSRLPLARYTSSVLVHLKMEYSIKWGNDVEGIRRLVAAFYIQMADSLKKYHNMVAVPTMDQLFVVQDNIVFKLVIVCEKLLFIMQKQVADMKDAGASRIESTPQARRLHQWQKKFVSEPLLQGALQSFSAKHAVYSDAVQILKRWLGAQLLSGAIPDLVLELVVAAALEQPGLAPPLTSWAAFRRTLILISTFNWVARPLMVDFFAEWKEEDIATMEANFIKMRPILPPMVIITNEDRVGSKWTRDGPSPILLKRVIGLATATLTLLDDNVTNPTPIDLAASLLSADTSAYDEVIHLNPLVVNRASESQKDDPKVKVLPVVDFDPVDELVYALNTNFQSVALFFYNKYGGKTIGIKWKPQEDGVPAKISRCHLHTSMDGGSRLALNRNEVLEGIEMMGKGIVSSIERRCSK